MGCKSLCWIDALTIMLDGVDAAVLTMCRSTFEAVCVCGGAEDCCGTQSSYLLQPRRPRLVVGVCCVVETTILFSAKFPRDVSMQLRANMKICCLASIEAEYIYHSHQPEV